MKTNSLRSTKIVEYTKKIFDNGVIRKVLPTLGRTFFEVEKATIVESSNFFLRYLRRTTSKVGTKLF